MVNPDDMRYMPGMAKQTKYPVRKLSYFSEEMAKAIDDFRYAQRIPSENEAIRQLINRGLEFDSNVEAIEIIGHIGGEFLRGVPVSVGDQMAFANAVIQLFISIDAMEHETLAAIEDLKRNMPASG